MKARITMGKATAYTLIFIGAIALSISIIYTSSILAFTGLGLLFWGAILTLIQTEEYTKKTLLDATTQPFLTTMNQLIQELDYKGTPTYLPPKYFQEPETVKIYIPKQKTTKIPTPEEIQQQEKQLFTQTPQGLLLTPPGAELTKLFEQTLETTFTQLDLDQLQTSLQKLLIEDLEIAENLEINPEPTKTTKKLDNEVSLRQIKQDTLYTRITNHIYKNTCNQTTNTHHTQTAIGCPLCSAIATAITKTTGKPVTITKTETNPDTKTTETTYKIIED